MADGKCYHHPSRDAVAKCGKCGKGICKDCYDSYGSEKALCFDCTEEMVKEHAADVADFREEVKRERIQMLIGMVAGALLGVFIGIKMDDLSYIFLIAAIGGSFGTIVKTAKTIGRGSDTNQVLGLLAFFFMCGRSPFITIYRFVKRFKQIKRANKIIENDSRVLQQMRDYFEYTQVIEKNKGVDLAKLAGQGSALSDNTYAKVVLDKGETAAQAELHQGTAQIAANGEIIESFDKKPKKKGKA